MSTHSTEHEKDHTAREGGQARAAQPEPMAHELEEEGGRPFFPNHLLHEISVMYLVFGVLLGLVAFLPFELAGKADPFNTPAHVKPEWYFLSLYQLLKFIPRSVAIAGSGVGAAILVLWPFIDRSRDRHPRRRPAVTALGVAGVVFMVVMGWWGHIS